MMSIKKINKTICFIISLLILVFTFNFNLKAYDVTSVASGAADYYVDHIIEEKELDFGVKYHNDFAYSRINDSGYSVGGACVAGGSSYDSTLLEYGKYYTQNVNVLEIPKNSGVKIVPYANIKLGAWTLTAVTSFIKRYEETHTDEKVIAAINGDFFDINSEKNYPRTSTGGTVSNGNYYKVNGSWKSIGFKIDDDGINMIGNILPTVSQKPYLEVIDSNDNIIYEKEIDKINENVSGSDEIATYFPMYDANHAVIKNNISDVILISGNEIAPFSVSSIYGKGEVKELHASLSLNANQFAISSNNSEVNEKLKVGTTVRVQYRYLNELEGYDNVIGYPNNLLLDGEVIKDPNYRHPRTMIGTTENGDIIMTTVDGRRTAKGYYGLAPIEQSALMQHYGCTNAFNLDGGGSTTMVILEDGRFVIKNEPSDNSPRNDGNCLLITVKVPKLEVSFENVSINSFDAKVDILEEHELYKEYYLYVNGETKKIVDGKASFSSLEKNSSYVYKVYTKRNGELLGLPITGTISTAKEKLEITSAKATLKVNKDEVEVCNIEITINDPDITFVNMVMEVNGKKYYAKDANNTFVIPLSELSNINTHLLLTYDLNDKNGRITLSIMDFNANYDSAYLALASISNDTDAWFDALLKDKGR